MKRKQIRNSSKAICVCLLLLSLCGCYQGEPPGEEPSREGQEVQELQPTKSNEVYFTQRTLLLEVGESAPLVLQEDGASVTYVSSKPDVAKVGEDGTVTALNHGNALITAQIGDSVAYCGVMVGLTGEQIDITGTEIRPYVDRTALTMPSIHQSFAIDPVNGDTYFLQKYDDIPSDLVANRLTANGTLEWMRLIDFGHGSGIAVERQENGEVYIWVSSDADINENCATVSRILWQPEKIYHENGGEVFTFPESVHTPIPYLDEENGLLCVRTRSGGRQRFTYYDFEMVKSGKSEGLIPLGEFSFQSGSTEAEPGYYPFQGFATLGRYIYVLEGAPYSQAQLVTWEMDGSMISLVKLHQDHLADQWNGYYEPEGLYISNDVLYFGIASNPSGNRRSSVFGFH